MRIKNDPAKTTTIKIRTVFVERKSRLITIFDGQ